MTVETKDIGYMALRGAFPTTPSKQNASVSCTSRFCKALKSALTFQSVTSAAEQFFSNRYVLSLLSLGGAAATTISAVLITPVLQDYTENCVDQLNSFSGIDHCRKPYSDSLAVNTWNIALCCGVLGYILQRTIEQKKRLIEQTPNENQHEDENILEKIKRYTRHVQDNYSYEISLGLGYLYNGLWLNTCSVPSWNQYFKDQTAAIGLAAGCLGMYARIQYIFLKEHMLQHEQSQQIAAFRAHCKDHWKTLSLSGTTVVVIALSATEQLPLSSQANQIALEISVMLLARPFGRGIAFLGRYWQAMPLQPCPKKLVQLLNTMVHLHTCMVGLGYYLYLFYPDQARILSGLSLVGFAEGAKDGCYQAMERVLKFHPIQPRSGNDSRCKKVAMAVSKFAANYWRTVAIVSFSIAASQTTFLDCYSIKEFICPISFELGGDYVNIDAKGVNIALASSLANYYIRKSCRILEHKPNAFIKKVSAFYLNTMDRYQFDLLSTIPYVMIQSGKYIKEYKAFASYDPVVLLVLLGITLGNYKERVNAGDPRDRYRPIFTDLSVVSSVL